MLDLLSQFKLQQMRPPVRRVLALDAGHRRIKLLLAESDFGRLRLLKEELIDLQAEGLVASEEIQAHLQATLEAWDNPPLALALPQHLSISQVIDLPPGPEEEVEKQIADEAIKLSGVSESRIVYDFVRTETAAKNRQQFWVTLCQEGDIRERLQRLGIEQEEICDITTTANALIAAFRATAPLTSRAILVHLGAQTTEVMILLAGQGAFASSFHMGGDFFTRALARLQGCPEETAESLKRQHNFLSGDEASAEFAAVVDGWVAELQRQLQEWFRENPGLSAEASSFEIIASGAGFDQPGLVAYLKSRAGLELHPWPKAIQPEALSPAKGFEIAYGTALQALGYSAQPVSLLLEDYRLAWGKRLIRQRIEMASVALAVLCLLVLGLGTWQKVSLLSRKQALLTKVQAAQKAVEENDTLTGVLTAEYENLRHLFVGQQNTLDTLKTLQLLQQSRSNQNFWYVLVADQQSYFSRPATLQLMTNRPPARTNLIGGPFDAVTTTMALFRTPVPVATNAVPAKPGLIAELCVPGDAEAARRLLSQVVNDLKQQPLFSKVDLLSDDLRRSLADPKVILPDRNFVLALDFAETEFQQAARWKKPVLAPRATTKRTARAIVGPVQSGDPVAQSASPYYP